MNAAIRVRRKLNQLQNKRSEAKSLGCISEGNLWVTVGDRIITLCPKAEMREIRPSGLMKRDLETEDMVSSSDTGGPKGSETVTAEPNSTAPDLDSTLLFTSV